MITNFKRFIKDFMLKQNHKQYQNKNIKCTGKTLATYITNF